MKLLLKSSKGTIHLVDKETILIYDNVNETTYADKAKNLEKWIKKLEVTETPNGHIRMGDWW